MASNRSQNANRSLTLVVAVGAVAAFAALAPSRGSTASVRAESNPPPSPPAAAADPAPPAWAQAAPGDAEGDAQEPAPQADTAVRGRVAEQLDVAKYSYLRLTGANGHDTWVAVPATSSRVGTDVTVTNAQLMTQFASASLKRTFDEIYFGVLDEAPSGAAAATEHAVQEPSVAMAEADPHSPQQAPHPGPGRNADSVPVVACEKASGPLGHTVAELHQLSASAAGTKARVRGTVVKVTSGVMGRTFIHLRDATGTAPLTNDLTVTTTEELTLGSQVLLEGTIKLNEDFGSGYQYPVLLADARVVAP